MTRHDDHYRRSNIEPIEQIEETFRLQINSGVDPVVALRIALANKYVQRAGIKKGQDAEIDIGKAMDYLHRAKHGRWPWENETGGINED